MAKAIAKEKEAKKVRVAVIGLGMGVYHLDVLSKNPRCEVTTLCDLRTDVAKTLAKKYGVPNISDDWKKVVADKKIDAVVVALPVYLHAPVAVAALHAGKHVLVEKPMAGSSADAKAMLDAAKKSKLILTIHHNQRFQPETHFLKKYIADGQLGTIHFARCIWTRPYGVLPDPSRNWFNEKEKGGGVLFDLGTHLLDKVLSLLDFPDADQYAATCFTVLGKEQERNTGYRFDADDLTVGMVHFVNGMTMQVEVGFGSHIERESLYFELYGDKGGVTTQGGVKLFHAHNGSAFVMHPGAALPAPKIPNVPDDFIDSIIAKRSPVITPESGLKVVQILEGLRVAAHKGWGK